MNLLRPAMSVMATRIKTQEIHRFNRMSLSITPKTVSIDRVQQQSLASLTAKLRSVIANRVHGRFFELSAVGCWGKARWKEFFYGPYRRT